MIKFQNFIIMIAALIIVSCDRDTNHHQPVTFSVKILSPKDNSFYYITNSLQFNLEAYDSSGNRTEIDSLKWVSSLDGVFIRYNDGYVLYGTTLKSPGLHKITGYAYKGNQVAHDDVSVLVTDSLYMRLQYSNNNWTVYQVPTEWVYTIEHDNSNNIIVGTLGSGLILRKNNLWTFFTEANAGLISNEIQCISVDNQNNIYVGDWTHNGINKYNGSIWSHILMPDSLWDVHSIAFRNDTLWAADHRGRILFYTGTWQILASQPREFEHPGKIAFDNNGVLWGNSEHGGSFRYDGTTWALLDSIGLTGCSYDLAIDQQNHIWFGTCSNGLYSYDGSTWTHFVMSNSQLPSNNISALCSDGSSNIWIGTIQGLVKLGPNGWTVFDTSNSPIPDNHIISVTVDDSNHVWIGTKQAITLFRNNLP